MCTKNSNVHIITECNIVNLQLQEGLIIKCIDISKVNTNSKMFHIMIVFIFYLMLSNNKSIKHRKFLFLLHKHLTKTQLPNIFFLFLFLPTELSKSIFPKTTL